MAINFLDNIQLNQNQLLGARLENVTSDPGSALGGDIIFNSTSNILKYYNGTSWVSLTADTVLPTATSTAIGGVKLFSDTDQSVAANAVSATAGRTYGVQFNSSDQMVVNVPGVDGSGTANTVAMFTAGGTIGNSIYSQNAGATEAKIIGGIFVTGYLKDSGGSTGTAGQLLSSTGTLTDWIDAPVSYTKWVLTGDSGTQDIEDGNTVLVAGGTNITTAVTSTDTVTVNLDASPTLAGELTVSGTGQSSFAGQVTIPTTPVATTDAASKSYVDSAVTGGLNVKGGFNASTGIVALTSVSLYTATAVAVGDYYIVTTAGDFFGQASTPLTVGDSVLVQTASTSPASITDFAVIQSDTDLATAATVGIGNVNVNAANSDKGGLTLSYGSGTGTVGVDIAGQDALAALIEMQFLVFDAADSGVNGKLDIASLSTYVNTVNSKKLTTTNQTTHTFTHSLNTFDVIVQLYDTSSKETVYASVDRTSVNVVTATTASSASLTALITKIG